MSPAPPEVSAFSSAGDAFTGVALPSRADVLIVRDTDGSFGGIVPTQVLAAVPGDDRETVRVRRLAIPPSAIATVSPATPVEQVLDAIAAHPGIGLAVVIADDDGLGGSVGRWPARRGGRHHHACRPHPHRHPDRGGQPARTKEALTISSAPGSIATTAAADAGGLDPTLLANYLEVIADVAGTQRRLTRTELNRFRFQGRRAALDGVPLRALVELYLTAAWRLWRHLPAVKTAPEKPGAAGRRRRGGAAGGRRGRRRRSRRPPARPARDDPPRRGGAPGAVRRPASRAVPTAPGWPPGRRISVSTSPGRTRSRSSRRRNPSSTALPLVTRLESSVLGAKGDANALVASKEGALVVIFAAPDDAAVDYVVGRLAHELGSPTEAIPSPPGRASRLPVQLRRPSGVGRWQITLGRARPGAGGRLRVLRGSPRRPRARRPAAARSAGRRRE